MSISAELSHTINEENRLRLLFFGDASEEHLFRWAKLFADRLRIDAGDRIAHRKALMGHVPRAGSSVDWRLAYQRGAATVNIRSLLR